MEAGRALDITFITSILCLPEHLIFRVLSFCSIEQLLALQSASWITRCLARFYTGRVWNFESRFSLWFSDPRIFQNMLYQCHGVVSGSQALQFFDRTYYPDSDMDIYVHHSQVAKLSSWVIREGYALQSGSARQDIVQIYLAASRARGHARSTSITLVLSYVKEETHWNGTTRCRKIQLIGLDMPLMQPRGVRVPVMQFKRDCTAVHRASRMPLRDAS